MEEAASPGELLLSSSCAASALDDAELKKLRGKKGFDLSERNAQGREGLIRCICITVPSGSAAEIALLRKPSRLKETLAAAGITGGPEAIVRKNSPVFAISIHGLNLLETRRQSILLVLRLVLKFRDLASSAALRYKGQLLRRAGLEVAAAFETGEAALRCASEVNSQLKLHNASRDEASQLESGCGLDWGEFWTLGQDTSGPSLEKSLRLAGVIAHSGEVLATRKLVTEDWPRPDTLRVELTAERAGYIHNSGNAEKLPHYGVTVR
eukprot:TRINITY_DN5427_c0_g3_i1.p1 TRINITY_DN5427_c0_g3~~TRINITY_DN5427_c0_g3_i1.p1  ORF type:complete len:267 (+),score=60.18 TRINITY_DN5427_c0_g3_i1:2-802(+)